MRTWTRAPHVMLCGGPCRKTIAAQSPIQLVTLPGLAKVRVRCSRCADGEPPADLPFHIEQRGLAESATSPERVKELAADAMKRLTGAYQPGLSLEDKR